MNAQTPKLITCVGVGHDLPLLPHFFRHYIGLGIAPENICVILNSPDADDPQLRLGEELAGEFGVSAPRLWIEPYTSAGMWEQRKRAQQEVADESDWIVSADVDELHEYPTDLPRLLPYLERKGVECVQGPFIDRCAPDGELRAVAPSPTLWEQFPVRADVACPMRKGEAGPYWYGTLKIMLMRGGVVPRLGGHRPEEDHEPVRHLYGQHLGAFPGLTRPQVRFALPFRVHHFKWTAALKGAVKQRLDTPGASEHGSRYGRALLQQLGDGDRVPLERIPIMNSDPLGPLPWRLRVAALRAYSSRAQR